MVKTSFVKDTREKIRDDRETRLDEIRKKQLADKKEKDAASVDFSYMMVATGSFLVGASPFIIQSLFSLQLPAYIGGMLSLAGFSGFALAAAKERAMKRVFASTHERETERLKRVEDKNRSENRDASRAQIRNLKKDLEGLKKDVGPYSTNAEMKKIRDVRNQIKSEEESLRQSSPSRKELATRLRPQLMDRLRNGGK